MKREIKFRVWDSISKKMYRWDIIKDLPISPFVELDHYTLLQYTGLQLPVGGFIYEGDILSSVCQGDKTTIQVYWSKDQAAFMAKFIDGNWDDELLCEIDLSGDTDGYEEPWSVIGNIYETPELVNYEELL